MDESTAFQLCYHLGELHGINKNLERIAEALEKLANKPDYWVLPASGDPLWMSGKVGIGPAPDPANTP